MGLPESPPRPSVSRRQRKLQFVRDAEVIESPYLDVTKLPHSSKGYLGPKPTGAQEPLPPSTPTARLQELVREGYSLISRGPKRSVGSQARGFATCAHCHFSATPITDKCGRIIAVRVQRDEALSVEHLDTIDAAFAALRSAILGRNENPGPTLQSSRGDFASVQYGFAFDSGPVRGLCDWRGTYDR